MALVDRKFDGKDNSAFKGGINILRYWFECGVYPCAREVIGKDGIFYQWFEMDERLTNPSDLKPSYTILYPTEEIYLDVNYYTDDIDEANLIASTSWGFTID